MVAISHVKFQNKSPRLCSACLLGVECRYDGKSKPNKKVLALAKEEKLIPVCPEQLGGLPIPHEPSEQKGGGVFDRQGNDVTGYFLKGAAETLSIAQAHSVKEAIFKQRSPSCGCGQIYDGSFTGKVIAGDGVATALLKKNGIKVITEEEL
jgi:uncharacterized protein YbbK (DUF523 family)